MLLPLTFPANTLRRLRKLLGTAPIEGNLDRANDALGDLWLSIDRRANTAPGIEIPWSIRFRLNDPHEVLTEFWIECPPNASLRRRRMMRTILVCAVMSGIVKDIAHLYRIAHQTRERIAALTTAPTTANAQPASEPQTGSVESVPSVRSLILALRCIAALPPENPTSIYRARMLANDQLRELANA